MEEQSIHLLKLEMFDTEFYFVAPDSIQIPEYITKELDEKEWSISYLLWIRLLILSEIDVLVWQEYKRKIWRYWRNLISQWVYKISKETILGKCQDHMIVMHPLPRVDEISVNLDDTKHALYFKQY